MELKAVGVLGIITLFRLKYRSKRVQIAFKQR